MPQETLQIINLGLIWFVVFLFSTTCHEAAHALAAKWGGDDTASRQVSLNPIPHIQREPFGMVLVPIVTFALYNFQWMLGWASAPYDPVWAYRHPRRAAWMALAGPAANFTIMILAAIAIRVGLLAGVFEPPVTAGFSQMVAAVEPERFGLVATFLSILFMLNLILGTFNLLPVPPLDGNAGITVLMSRDSALRFLEFTRDYAMAGLVVAWVLYGRMFPFIFSAALNGLYLGVVRYG